MRSLKSLQAKRHQDILERLCGGDMQNGIATMHHTPASCALLCIVGVDILLSGARSLRNPRQTDPRHAGEPHEMLHYLPLPDDARQAHSDGRPATPPPDREVFAEVVMPRVKSAQTLFTSLASVMRGIEETSQPEVWHAIPDTYFEHLHTLLKSPQLHFSIERVNHCGGLWRAIAEWLLAMLRAREFVSNSRKIAMLIERLQNRLAGLEMEAESCVKTLCDIMRFDMSGEFPVVLGFRNAFYNGIKADSETVATEADKADLQSRIGGLVSGVRYFQSTQQLDQVERATLRGVSIV